MVNQICMGRIVSDNEYSKEQYQDWFDLLKDHIEEEFVGTHVEVEEVKSGLLYESYDKLCDEDSVYSISVYINEELSHRTRLYALLHEAGHIKRMAEDGHTKTFFYRYLDNVPDNLKFRTRTVIEEVLAWYEAEKIADGLDIKLEERPWQREVEKAIELYTIWCANKRS